MRRVTFAFASLILAAGTLISQAAGEMRFQSVLSSNPKDYDYEGVDNQFRSEIADALKARSAGNTQAAIKHFRAASRMPIYEFPNYALWLDLAELYCLTGQKKRGQALLADFSCAADVMAARKMCWLDRDGGTTHRNPTISSRCYRTVCDEMYAGYFGQEPGASIEYKSDREKIRKVGKVCR